MYDNNNYPQYYQNTDPNGQYNSYGAGGQYNAYGNAPYTEPPKPPKKKKVSGALITGLLLAAMVIGGVSGFGGSFLANRMNSSVVDGTDDYNSSNTRPDESRPAEVTTAQQPHIAPENPVDDDLSGLSNMVAMNITTAYNYEELYKAVNESIVIVNNYVKNGYSSDEYTKQGIGSGVIFTTDGYIVTNEHVIRGASKITVVVEDKYSKTEEEADAQLIGLDQATDLAVLKVSRSRPYTAVPLGNSDTLNIGQQICAIGNPAGLSKTLTGGYISGLNRFTSDKGYVLSSIQTDAAINPGNSGGGLFDMYGNVIGIVNSKIIASDSSIENLGFAITINEAKPIISDLINYGFVKGRTVLGIQTQSSQYSYNVNGLLVAEIDQEAPIAKSDLRVNDIIVAVEGQEVSEVEDVQEIIKNMKAGDKVTLHVIRPTKIGSGYFAQVSYDELDIEVILTESRG